MAKPLLKNLVPEAKIKAYHGSPYEFDRFDDEAIGTGEGAQAYGFGHYLAEREVTAKSYRDALSATLVVLEDGTEIKYGKHLDNIKETLKAKFPQIEDIQAHQIAKSTIDDNLVPGDVEGFSRVSIYDKQGFLKYEYDGEKVFLEAIKANKKARDFKGYMYEAAIDAADEDLLDYDAPLSQQSEKIQKIFPPENYPETFVGRSLYDFIAGSAGIGGNRRYGPDGMRQSAKQTSARLKELGIKGIKYADAQTRFKKDPADRTKNYVIFDPAIIEITKRYGIGIPAAAAFLQAEEADAGIKFPPTVYRPGQEGFDPRFDPRVKEQDRLAGTAVDLLPVTDTENVPTLKLSDLEGESFVTSMSDRTAAGDFITAIDGVQLPQPVRRRGGQDFMLENPGQVWASALTPSRAIVQTAKELRDKTGKDPLYLPFRMAPTGGDFAVETGETMLGFAAANMNKTQKRSLDAAIRKYKTVGNMVQGQRRGAGLQIKDWFGVDDPRSIDAWRSAPDTLRKELMNMMDVRFRDKGGLSMGQARLAVADHRQLSARDAGLQNVGRVTQGDVVASTHPSYPFAAPGEFVGRLEGAEDATAFDLLPDARFGAGQRKVKDPANPTQQEIRALTMKPYAGQITEKTLRDMEKRGIDVRSIAPAAVATGAVAATSESQAAFAEKRDQKNTAWTQLKDAVGSLDPSFKQLSQLLSDTAKTNPMLQGQREIGGFLANSLAGMGSGFMGAAAYNEADPSAMDYFSGEQIEGARDFVRNIPQAIGLGSMEENLINQALMDAMQGVGDVVSDTAAYQAFVEPALQDIAPDAMEFYEGLDPRLQGQLSGIFEYIGNAIR